MCIYAGYAKLTHIANGVYCGCILPGEVLTKMRKAPTANISISEGMYETGAIVQCRKREWVLLPGESPEVFPMNDPATVGKTPREGDIVRLRTRSYLVEQVTPGPAGCHVRAACLDDDAQGEILEVVWEVELDAEVLQGQGWLAIGRRSDQAAPDFDPPRHFGAYLHTLRWNTVTATDPNFFQSPFRAGIRIEPFQLAPLNMALRLPRVNLFIADDVGLGKTIEAGLIASELLLRRRIREIVVACPPSMTIQWRDELEARFGLSFEILDRDYVARMRQEQGYAVNPWTTHPRFIVSHRLLIDEAYAAPLRDWLDNLRPGSLLILDEAHHAAPASGSRYAIDTHITRAVRDLAPRFEHRLFLSATPHNGHTNSFSALLEILDAQRFCRGVRVLKSHRDEVMVRRLKEDVRAIAGGFPRRDVVQVDITDLPEDAPELLLSRLLDEYATVRAKRVAGATKRKQNEAALLISGLQQRLLSSIPAFARTLQVHRKTMERLWEQPRGAAADPADSAGVEAGLRFATPPDADDEQAADTEDEAAAADGHAAAALTTSTAGDAAAADIRRERDLLERMSAVAEASRAQPDARVLKLVAWIRENLCLSPSPVAGKTGSAPVRWNERRLIVFTEYEDTRRYLVSQIETAFADTDRIADRIEIFTGATPAKRREEIKRAFNAPPGEHPVRILVATDAAREGLNLQAHCHDLFHFDLPWNPARIEQRDGRIDRKLQPSPVVTCRYFYYAQRPEDRVVSALVRKTRTIREELGSLSKVVEDRLDDMLRRGIRHAETADLVRAIEAIGPEGDLAAIAYEDLESVRAQKSKLVEEIAELERKIDRSRRRIGLDADALRDALSCSLEILGVESLKPAPEPGPAGEPPRFIFPNLVVRHGADASWHDTLDTLRKPPDGNQSLFEWRREAPLRPVVLDAPAGVDDSVVQIHLHHRLVRRLLSRFQAQGFVHHDLSRACLMQVRDNTPRVILLGRLSLYGPGAVRLHEEMIAVAARWSPCDRRQAPLTPYAQDAESRALELLEESLVPGRQAMPGETVRHAFLASLNRDIEELLPHLRQRADTALAAARDALAERGRIESQALVAILKRQRERIQTEYDKSATIQLDLFATEERRTFESNRRYWQRWLDNVDADLERESARTLNFYAARFHRLDPVGIAYLAPAPVSEQGVASEPAKKRE